jgi:hypothetical protein
MKTKALKMVAFMGIILTFVFACSPKESSEE